MISNENGSYNLDDQLIAYADKTYTYDNDGYLFEKIAPDGTTTYTYGGLGELKKVVTPDKTIDYLHNANSQRVAKKVNGVVKEKYLWENLTKLLAIYDKDDNVVQRFEYAGQRMPVSMSVGSEKYYLHYDQVGSLRAVSDTNHNIVKQIDYDTFGNILHDSNPDISVPFGFAGGLYDNDTGLVRFGFRDYDPFTGRWTARDPIDFAGGDSNLYGYVFSDPVNWVDQDGLAPIPGGTDLGGGNSVRIDTKNLQPNQQPHAHFQSPKGKGIVNIDGTGSHGKKSNIENLNKKLKKYLRTKGFKLSPLFFLPNPQEVLQEYCNENPFSPMCSSLPPPEICI